MDVQERRITAAGSVLTTLFPAHSITILRLDRREAPGRALALHAAGAPALDEVALDGDEERDRSGTVITTPAAMIMPQSTIVALKRSLTPTGSVFELLGRDEDEGEEEIVPGQDEGEDAVAMTPGQGQAAATTYHTAVGAIRRRRPAPPPPARAGSTGRTRASSPAGRTAGRTWCTRAPGRGRVFTIPSCFTRM